MATVLQFIALIREYSPSEEKTSENGHEASDGTGMLDGVQGSSRFALSLRALDPVCASRLQLRQRRRSKMNERYALSLSILCKKQQSRRVLPALADK